MLLSSERRRQLRWLEHRRRAWRLCLHWPSSVALRALERMDAWFGETDDTGRPVASSFSVSRPGHDSLTELEGSSSRHEVTLSEADFTPEALRSPTAKTR